MKRESTEPKQLVAALGAQDDPQFRPTIFKALKVLGLDLNEGKDSVGTLRRGEIAHRVEFI